MLMALKRLSVCLKLLSVVSGVKFIPTFLSEGEAARIHFPTIVTDSVAGKTEITGADWGTNNFSTFKNRLLR